jgi:hypothetical protein
MKKLTPWQFGDRLPHVALTMVNELIERRRVEAHLDAAKMIWGSLLLVCLPTLFIYIQVRYPLFIEQFYFADIEKAISSDWVFAVMSLFTVVGSIRMYQLQKKYEEAEEEYESLRHEFIDRCEELFAEPEQWDYRHHVFAHLEQQCDINLYHK